MNIYIHIYTHIYIHIKFLNFTITVDVHDINVPNSIN